MSTAYRMPGFFGSYWWLSTRGTCRAYLIGANWTIHLKAMYWHVIRVKYDIFDKKGTWRLPYNHAKDQESSADERHVSYQFCGCVSNTQPVCHSQGTASREALKVTKPLAPHKDSSKMPCCFLGFDSYGDVSEINVVCSCLYWRFSHYVKHRATHRHCKIVNAKILHKCFRE